jgi:hypothetical protein
VKRLPQAQQGNARNAATHLSHPRCPFNLRITDLLGQVVEVEHLRERARHLHIANGGSTM